MSDESSRAPGTACPTVETLAEFVDGRLGARERAAVIEHLADCDACREVVAETVRLLSDSEGATARREEAVRALPTGRNRLRIALGAGLVAAVLACAVGLTLYLRVPSVERVLSEIAARGSTQSLPAEWADPLWPVLRSGSPRLSDRALAFRLGVRTADLELAAAAGDTRRAEGLAEECARLLARSPFADLEAEAYEQLARALSEPGIAPEEAASRARLGTTVARSRVDQELFDLGRWSEAGRLAAIAGLEVTVRSRVPLPESARELETALAEIEGARPTERAEAYAQLIALAGDLP